MYKDALCQMAFDSVIFAGTKFTLHKIIDGKYFHQVDGMDILVFFIADGVYYMLLRNFTAGYFTSHAIYRDFITKYGTIILGVTLFDLLIGDKHRVISNLISIGVSGGVVNGLSYFFPNIMPGIIHTVGTEAPTMMPV
jgi:hypothetical protein